MDDSVAGPSIVPMRKGGDLHLPSVVRKLQRCNSKGKKSSMPIPKLRNMVTILSQRLRERCRPAIRSDHQILPISAVELSRSKYVTMISNANLHNESTCAQTVGPLYRVQCQILLFFFFLTDISQNRICSSKLTVTYAKRRPQNHFRSYAFFPRAIQKPHANLFSSPSFLSSARTNQSYYLAYSSCLFLH